jgi:hypothetical protein
VVGQYGILGSSSDSLLANYRDLGISVGREFVDGYHHRNSKGPGILNVLSEVAASRPQNLDILFLVNCIQWCARCNRWAAAMNLERTNGRNDHNDVRHEAGSAALDVEKSLTTHGEIEAGLGDYEARLLIVLFLRLSADKFESHLVGENRARSDADVGKWSCMDEHWGAFQGLHQIGLDGILHEGSQGSARANVIAGDRITAAGAGDNHATESLPHVVQA